MKKTHVFGLMVFAVVVFSVMVAASASAATLQWLDNGKPITTPQLADVTGTVEIGNEHAVAGFKVSILCTFESDGTVGPGAEGLATEFLDSSEKRVELGVDEPVCTNDSSCPKPSVVPAHLPWLVRIELMGTEAEPLFLDVAENGGKGEPGWEIMCEEPLIGLVEETCTSVPAKLGSADLENDPAENDVLGTVVLEEITLCSGTNEETGFVSTGTEPGLILLVSGEALSVSYE
jgi:hypothetical protein